MPVTSARTSPLESELLRVLPFAELAVDCADAVGEPVQLEELERRYVRAVLQLFGGNKTRVAIVLGIDRRTLHRKLARYRARAKAWP